MYPVRTTDRVPSFSTENENREESGRQSLTKLVGVTHNVFREFLSPGALGVNTYNPGDLNPTGSHSKITGFSILFPTVLISE